MHGARWVAWLASDGPSTAPEDDIVPGQFFQNTGGWVRPDGAPFARSLSSLMAGAVLHAMNVTELGAVTTRSAWSAARLDGTLRRVNNAAVDCAGWTSSDPGLFGSISTSDGVGNNWTGEFIAACSGTAALHCFGDDPGPELAIVTALGRLAFVSSSRFTPGAGVIAADELCQRDACAAGLTGSPNCTTNLGTQRTFRSYLHTAAQPAWQRFDLNGPTWVRPDGIAWLTSAADLADDASARLTGLNVTPALQYLVNDERTWLGASSGEETCSNWTSSAGAGRSVSFNDASPGRTLTAVGFANTECTLAAPVFCLET